MNHHGEDNNNKFNLRGEYAYVHIQHKTKVEEKLKEGGKNKYEKKYEKKRPARNKARNI